jgi:acetolactate decarboxylase
MRDTAPTHTVTQVSILNALLARRFDGLLPCGELLRHGDFGIGTYDRMDGEMILLDGIFYQGRAGGGIHLPDPATLTPFATVCRFVADRTWEISAPVDYAGLDAAIDAQAPNRNVYLAIRVEGTFPLMRIHALVEQHAPYPPTAEVVKGCVRAELTDVRGTIVGFRGVPWVRGINDTGYHLHFITEDRTRGGHVLAFEMAGGTVALGTLNDHVVLMPEAALAGVDLSQDLVGAFEAAMAG